MFQVNDIIVYGNSEVCSIKDIGIPDFIESKEEYYSLQPICNTATTLYVKTTNALKPMRIILSKEKATELLCTLPSITSLYDKNDRVREKEYATIIRSCECMSWFQMLKGILEEKDLREKDGKKLNANDERNLNKVESCLSAEFSKIFNITMEQALTKIHGAIS